jgi:hypothetical protein
MGRAMRLVLWAALAVSGCTASPATDAGTDAPRPMAPAHSCGQPEIAGNDQGVGAFCTPGGRECQAFSLAPLCLADLVPAEEQWYCTRTCVMDSQCGADAVCVGDARGHGCVPTRCGFTSEGDAGSDSGATDDAATDDAAVDAGP